LNLGLKSTTYSVIGFLGGGAIPATEWLEKHAEAYESFDIAGVAGDVILLRSEVIKALLWQRL
jgi:hypothetical protein